MANLTLNDASRSADTTRDGIIIIDAFLDIPGGVTLDATGWTDETLYAGQGVIQRDADGEYLPLPTTGVIPAAHTAIGVVKGSVLTSKAAVGVVIGGSVRESAMEYPVSAAFKTAVNLIKFL